ncbi:hypothetical protein ACRE_030230 [Hapsidospora chrysogenum ATCC 11550]|uniref:Uncharacterized protein n=1 Tax=Hapsidospora chrysogenum (strain ATCC 11550 / CBS 779.69 / DSM 880 / IAM 14645 / JCM 23072 / IMI 49137) TaxID=857340 RepID=A0A086T9Z3_HAPC1|nr:hypothetical protein ACRE_030230 [Hapsidospora chrysogenum ATCC 11550]
MDDEAGGLLSIALSDSDSDQQTCASTTRASRTGQTEEEYQAVKRSYHVKVENGNVYKNVTLPLEKGSRKQLIQEVLYAAEELYFFRRFEEAATFLGKVLAEGNTESEALDQETRVLLINYKQKCEERLNQKAT